MYLIICLGRIGVSVGVGVGSTDGFGVGLAGTLTPLLHTSFLPDLIHLYLRPFTVEVEFSFVHVAPAFVTAFAVLGRKTKRAHEIASATL
jgi:hypothetical protein